MAEEIRRLACIISGNVQGIGFRWSARELAVHLGITGYARNLGDGRVEVVAEGAASALETLRVFCYRGPDGSAVTGVEVAEGSATGEFPHFEIR
ncbi:MAG: acylphosphatase [bacterium]|nr:acylphosphatase [bacterium]